MTTEEQTTEAAAAAEERIRKVYAKDLKLGDAVHTVFRAAEKEKHTSRGGKTFLSLTLQDRTGEVDGRVFENVEAAEKTFVDGDYLLVKGKVGVFHGKHQVVLERLERLDPTPLDAREFTPPPREPKAEPPARGHEASADAKDAKDARKAARSRVMRLLDDPAILDGLAALFRHVDGWAEGRGAERTHERTHERGAEPRKPKAPRPPRIEHRPDLKPASGEAAVEPKRPERDASLPGKFAFKPFSAIAGEQPPAEQPPTESPAPEAPEKSAGEG